MSELGHFLKQAREEKKLTLDQIQEITKIRKRYLEAIETGDYSVLPGHFYARAFIKSYAEALGLQANDVLKQYSDEVPQVEKAPVVETYSGQRTKEVSTTSPFISKWITKLVLYSFIFIVLFLTYLAVVKYLGADRDQTIGPGQQNQGVEGEGNFRNPVDEEEEEPIEEEPTEGDETVTEPEQPSQPELTLLSSDTKLSTFQYKHGDEVIITLKAEKGDIWFDLTDVPSKKRIHMATLKKGNEESWNVSENQEINFHFGNMANFTLLINGEIVDFSHLENRRGSHRVTIILAPLSEEA